MWDKLQWAVGKVTPANLRFVSPEQIDELLPPRNGARSEFEVLLLGSEREFKATDRLIRTLNKGDPTNAAFRYHLPKGTNFILQLKQFQRSVRVAVRVANRAGTFFKAIRSENATNA